MGDQVLDTVADVFTLGVYSSVKGMNAADDASKRQREAATLAKNQNAAAEVANRRKSLREERIRRAQILSQAETLGVSGSSTAISAEGMSGAIAGDALSSSGAKVSNINASYDANQAIADAQARQQYFSNIGAVSGKIISAGAMAAGGK